jgi:hypothetical protein
MQIPKQCADEKIFRCVVLPRLEFDWWEIAGSSGFCSNTVREARVHDVANIMLLCWLVPSPTQILAGCRRTNSYIWVLPQWSQKLQNFSPAVDRHGKILFKDQRRCMWTFSKVTSVSTADSSPEGLDRLSTRLMNKKSWWAIQWFSSKARTYLAETLEFTPLRVIDRVPAAVYILLWTGVDGLFVEDLALKTVLPSEALAVPRSTGVAWKLFLDLVILTL